MTNYELLEKAARAAGYEIAGENGTGVMARRRDHPGTFYWNPLDARDVALRLAADLNISHGLDDRHGRLRAYATYPSNGAEERHTLSVAVSQEFDCAQAECLAIVDAAAHMAAPGPTNTDEVSRTVGVDHERLEAFRLAILDAQQAYVGAITAELPIGTQVDYQHGDRWIGPYEVTAILGTLRPGYLSVKNLSTGKVREVWVERVRLAEDS